ncbi:MAG TPA: peptide deformylase [Dehalococcoidia bacterium]|nr:peptide deformylase [Dehalococcoidia bacterium]
MRELLTLPNPILRKKCHPVGNFNKEIKELIEELAGYMYAHRTDEIAPIGLTAPQLGESLQVIVFYPNPAFREKKGIEELINPELVYARESITVTESCLSLPGKTYTLQRAKLVKVRGYNFDGRKRTYKARALFAQMFQHELNHLDGILIDRIGELIVFRK